MVPGDAPNILAAPEKDAQIEQVPWAKESSAISIRIAPVKCKCRKKCGIGKKYLRTGNERVCQLQL